MLPPRRFTDSDVTSSDDVLLSGSLAVVSPDLFEFPLEFDALAIAGFSIWFGNPDAYISTIHSVKGNVNGNVLIFGQASEKGRKSSWGKGS